MRTQDTRSRGRRPISLGPFLTKHLTSSRGMPRYEDERRAIREPSRAPSCWRYRYQNTPGPSLPLSASGSLNAAYARGQRRPGEVGHPDQDGTSAPGWRRLSRQNPVPAVLSPPLARTKDRGPRQVRALSRSAQARCVPFPGFGVMDTSRRGLRGRLPRAPRTRHIPIWQRRAACFLRPTPARRFTAGDAAGHTDASAIAAVLNHSVRAACRNPDTEYRTGPIETEVQPAMRT